MLYQKPAWYSAVSYRRRHDSEWYRIAGSKILHLRGDKWIETGISLCGEVDLTRAGFFITTSPDVPAHPVRIGHRYCTKCEAMRKERRKEEKDGTMS